MTDNTFGLVLVTASSETEAKAIASSLVTEFLGACVSVSPVHSIYRWQDKVNVDQEWQLVIKTDLTLFSQLATRIKQLHSYEVPEIIALPLVKGEENYLAWIAQNTKSVQKQSEDAQLH